MSTAQGISEADRTRVVDAIRHHDSMRHSWFWRNDQGNARARGYRERQLRQDVTVEANGHVYRYQARVHVRRSRVYYRGLFSRDGEAGTVRLFKGLL